MTETQITGHNEITGETERYVVVRLYNTDIVRVDKHSKLVTISIGGFHTRTTQNHINRALNRLQRRFYWIPYVWVSFANSEMTIYDAETRREKYLGVLVRVG